MSLRLDRPQARLTDSVQLVVSVSGSRDSGSEPVIQGLENFSVTPGGTSSRIEFINGRMSSGIEYTYYIQPQQVGSFTIGPASVQIGDKTYRSNRSSLQVVRPAGDQGGDEQRPDFPGSRAFSAVHVCGRAGRLHVKALSAQKREGHQAWTCPKTRIFPSSSSPNRRNIAAAAGAGNITCWRCATPLCLPNRVPMRSNRPG